ncbi:Leucine dehydrogenase [compost metagenome]
MAVQGLGSVGWELCRRLHEAGATLTVADIDAGRTTQAQQQFGARVVSPEAITAVDTDVFAPCALGAVVTPAVAESCRFRVIAGGANNQLASLAEGDILHQRGIFYAPDFLINAGGIVSCAREYLGGVDESALRDEVAGIRERVLRLAQRVESTGQAPARAAVTWAHEVLSRGIGPN